MTILLTGATGFTGSHLLNIIPKSRCKIILLLRNEKPYNSFQNFESISESQLNLLNSNESPKIDVIVHLATHFTSNHTWDDIDALINANIKLGIKLLEIAKTHNARFINTSSFAQCLSKETPFAQNLYSQTKKSFQEIIQFYCRNENITAFDLELFDSYGPDDRRSKFYKLAIDSFLKNEEFRMSSGQQEICLIHIDDVCRAIIQCIFEKVEEKGYYSYTLWSSKTVYKLIDLAHEIKEICKSKSIIEAGFYPYRKNEIFQSTSNLNPLPKWFPKISLKEGINQIIKQND
jgi:nucleoside-diphosphate-sugar epimerase